MKKLIIYGNGDFAKLIAHHFKINRDYKLIAFCADKQFITGTIFNGLPIYSTEEINKISSPEDVEIFVAIGYKSMRAREKMFDKAKSLGFNFASLHSKNAFIDETAIIGKNSVIFPGSQIEPNVKICDNCIIWTSSVICHDSIIAEHSFVAAQSVIGGHTKIGRRCFLGFNSTIIHNVTIGDDCLIGAKSLVTRDIPSNSKCIGIPAKAVDRINPEGIFIK